jgi:hypothetical protein
VQIPGGNVAKIPFNFDENGDGRSRLDIREGGWVRVNNLDGGTYRDFYVAGVTVQDEGNVVTLTVSDVAFDLLDLGDNLAAGWIVYLEAGHSFAPWSCWR